MASDRVTTFAALLLTASLGSAVPTSAQTPSPATPPKPAGAAGSGRSPRVLDEPKVLSAAEMARRTSGGSSFLSPPGEADRYGGATPWADAPPWRRASFYGVRSIARTVVFVVDRSGSMGEGDRLERAKRELRRSVADLQFPQQFHVILYNDQLSSMPGGLLRSAEVQAKDGLVAWLRTIDPEGGTDPRAAIRMALSVRPDAIYLLSDGAFPLGTADDIAERNTRKIPIHCIDLAGGSDGDHLRRIARESGGQYASRP